MKRILRVLLPVVTVIGLFIANTVPAYAATTADVTITATPTYIALTISNAPNTWAIGTVAESTTYYWTADSLIPAEPLVDGDMKETITNTGSVAEDIDIHTHNASGGVGWTVSTDDTPAQNEFSLRAGITGMANRAAMVQVITTDAELVDNLAASGTKMMCLEFETGTFTDGVAKSTTATLTASAAN